MNTMRNTFPRRRYYMNLETGELLTYREMIEQAEELYDFGDYTNALELLEYYELTDIEVVD